MSTKRAVTTTPLQIFCLALGGILAALLLSEFGARLLLPRTPLENFVLQLPYDIPRYLPDEKNGYLPRFEDPDPGPGFAYDSKGVNRDLSIHRGEGKEKILFLGDSVIRRGNLLRALNETYAGNHWQLLNAGVDGYDIGQEAGYFRRFASANEPGRIVIALSNNDFTDSPRLCRQSGYRVFWSIPGEPPIFFNLRLYHWSRLYRKWVESKYNQLSRNAQLDNRLLRESRTALAELKEWCAVTHAKLQAIVLPLMKKYSEWSEEEKKSRETALQITKELGIETFDPLPAIDHALARNVALMGENPADYRHPSPEAAKYLAEELKQEGLFRGLPLNP